MRIRGPGERYGSVAISRSSERRPFSAPAFAASTVHAINLALIAYGHVPFLSVTLYAVEPEKAHMTDQHAASRARIVLLVNRQEWTARSMESVLQPAGFAVVKAYTGRQAIELAGRLRPDLVILDYKLTDILGLDACRAIRELPTVDDTTPFVIATTASLSRKERHECFREGIWDILSSPFDPVELVCKLKTFLSARRQVEEAWESTHKDPTTGL